MVGADRVDVFFATGAEAAVLRAGAFLAAGALAAADLRAGAAGAEAPDRDAYFAAGFLVAARCFVSAGASSGAEALTRPLLTAPNFIFTDLPPQISSRW